MSEIGYYRIKVSNLAVGTHTAEFKVGGITEATKTIVIKPFCTGWKRLKFLDHNGHYRFYAFNEFYREELDVKSLGKSNKVITTILSDQSNKKNIGGEVEKTVYLSAEEVSQDEIDILKDLLISPRIYYYIGDESTDNPADWLQVLLKDNTYTVRRSKGDYYTLNLEIELPEYFNVKMI